MARGVISLVKPRRAIRPIEREPESTSSVEAALLLRNHFTNMVRPAPDSTSSIASSPVLAGVQVGRQQIRGGVFSPRAQGVGGNFL